MDVIMPDEYKFPKTQEEWENRLVEWEKYCDTKPKVASNSANKKLIRHIKNRSTGSNELQQMVLALEHSGLEPRDYQQSLIVFGTEVNNAPEWLYARN